MGLSESDVTENCIPPFIWPACIKLPDVSQEVQFGAWKPLTASLHFQRSFPPIKILLPCYFSFDENREQLLMEPQLCLIQIWNYFRVSFFSIQIDFNSYLQRYSEENKPTWSKKSWTTQISSKLQFWSHCLAWLIFSFSPATGPMVNVIPVPGPDRWCLPTALGALVLLAQGCTHALGTIGSSSEPYRSSFVPRVWVVSSLAWAWGSKAREGLCAGAT